MKPTESASSAQVLKKTQPEQYDLVILGDGTGSTLAAWTFASDGKSVAVVERKFIGGSCPPATRTRQHIENEVGRSQHRIPQGRLRELGKGWR